MVVFWFRACAQFGSALACGDEETAAAPRRSASANTVLAPTLTRPMSGMSTPFGSARGPCATTILPFTSTPANGSMFLPGTVQPCPT